MKNRYTRRDILKLGLNAGLALSPFGLASCGGGGGGTTDIVDNGGDDSGYKALVCVFLRNGNDAYNTIVPMASDRYAQYAAIRANLAVASANLLPLAGVAGDGAAYGMHPRCPELATLFNGGGMAIVTNVGSMVGPTTRADYLATRNLPARLFSHNDQQDQWATSQAEGGGTQGWGGRMGQVLADANAGALLPMHLSLSGNNLYQSARSGAPLTVSTRGPQHLSGLAPGSSLRAAYDALRALPHDHVFERQYAHDHTRGIALHAALEHALNVTAPPATAFPAGDFGDQLAMIARIIGARGVLGMKRQVFYAMLGNFDTHDAQLDRHPVLLERLSQGLGAFHAATQELGVAGSVTTFTMSDFGRSLSINGDGTDHGWAGHQFVIGGAVRGGQFYGSMPSLEVDGADDSSGGRFIPTTSVDEYAASLATWFGVTDGNLADVLPNIGRFATRGLPLLG
jgi:uncharacterized protein (DUF1501 family)